MHAIRGKVEIPHSEFIAAESLLLTACQDNVNWQFEDGYEAISTISETKLQVKN